MPHHARVREVALHFLPVETRVPLKFGTEALTSVVCARVRMTIEGADGSTAVGWGETPLSVQWVWPSTEPYGPRLVALQNFCRHLATRWAGYQEWGHPVELAVRFERDHLLPSMSASSGEAAGALPWLAALVCQSAFDLALHDAYGNLHERDVFELYGAEHLETPLADLLEPATGSGIDFAGRTIADFLDPNPPTQLPVWHLVGGLDALDEDDLTGDEPDDGIPVLLADWIETDGLRCLKIKCRGNDAAWDLERIIRVGQIGRSHGVRWLSTDFNCTVKDPDYVNEILDRLRDTHPDLYGMILYVEQPFPYELAENRIDVHSVAARKPLFLDESAHDWEHVRLGRELGWSGVALKTCKTQTGALLSLCWAKAHGMPLMVQDLTNPMLAMIPHARLGAHAGTIMGVECNSMQFYPAASAAEEKVHPGLYRRREGVIDLSSVNGSGFGMRVDEIERALPVPDVECTGS